MTRHLLIATEKIEETTPSEVVVTPADTVGHMGLVLTIAKIAETKEKGILIMLHLMTKKVVAGIIVPIDKVGARNRSGH